MGDDTANDSATDTATKVFEQHRSVLTGVAYRTLGRFADVEDVEDVVQEGWLGWDRADRRQGRTFPGGIARKGLPEAAFAFQEVNGAPVIVVISEGRPHTVLALDVADGVMLQKRGNFT